MNAQEAGMLLAKIGQYDSAVYPSDPGDQMRKAVAWAEALSTVLLTEAQRAVTAFYKANSSRSITISDIYVAHLAEAEKSGVSPAPCNPLIIDPKHDLDGRYCVTCAACGYHADVYCSTLEAAQIARDNHERHQARNDRTTDVDSGKDWSEPRPLDGAPADLLDTSLACPTCGAKPGDACSGDDLPLEFHGLNHQERNPISRRRGIEVYYEEMGKPVPTELRVACPWCKASPWERCIIKATGKPMSKSHPRRVEAQNTPQTAVSGPQSGQNQ